VPVRQEGCELDDDAPACIEIDAEACMLQDPLEFDRIFTETVAGGACHGAGDAVGAVRGLHISDADTTHAILRGGGEEFVTPGDPSCSLLVVRMNTDDAMLLVPPGAQPLHESVRCSVARWIGQGAQR
jgi:hypothetical protein